MSSTLVTPEILITTLAALCPWAGRQLRDIEQCHSHTLTGLPDKESASKGLVRLVRKGARRWRAWPTARGELRSALASAPYVLTLPQGMAEHTCHKETIAHHESAASQFLPCS